MNITDVAKLAGVSRQAVSLAVKEGRIPASVLFTGKIVISPTAAKAYVAHIRATRKATLERADRLAKIATKRAKALRAK